MVLVESTMLSLGTKVPEFSLPDVVSGKTVSLSDFSDNKALLVMFICRHCPYVVEKLKEMAKNLGFNFPYLFDETQEVAKAFTAACTPDFFLFDKDKKLIYRGQLDNSRPGSGQPVTGRDLREAIDAILSGKPVSEEQRPSSGCNIKWKS